MNWKFKSLIFKLLEKLPHLLGNKIYYSIQGFTQYRSLNIKFKEAGSTYNSLVDLLNKFQITLEDKNILEIGTGWYPLMPYYLVYHGKAKQVLTYDVNWHLSVKNIESTNKLFREFYCENKTNVVDPKILDNRIVYFHNSDIDRIDISKIEIVYSRFVLEHVSKNDLIKIHNELKLKLPAGSLIIHFISPSDHRAYNDHNLSLYDFLKYSESEWNEIQTRFDFHNRLRKNEYIQIFQNVGLEIVHFGYTIPDKNSKSYQLFKKLNLNEDYKNLSEDELLAASFITILRT